MSEQHTPGPWEVNGHYIQPTGAPEPIAKAFGPVDDLYIPWRANARLIAAAPELLEALQRATKACDVVAKMYDKVLGIERNPDHWDGLVADCHAVIAKALGQKATV